MTAEERAALKLNIDEAKFLEAVDREGNHEIGVGSAMTADRRAALVEKANTAYYRAGTMATPEERMAAAIDLIRAEVLEEAANICEAMKHDPITSLGKRHNGADKWMCAALDDAAAAIRALKEKNNG